MEKLIFEKNYYDEIYSKLVYDEPFEIKSLYNNIIDLKKNFKALGLMLKNRLCLSNYYDELFDINGKVNDNFFDFFYKIAKSGVGMICSSGINVEAKNNNFSEKNQKSIAEHIKNIHSTGAKIFLTLKTKLGRISKVAHSVFLLSSSFNREYYCAKNFCLPILDSKCKNIAKLFGNSARFAKNANFDGIVIDGSLSNIIGELSSSEFNRRIFGVFSSIDDMSKKILDNINQHTRNFPIIYKITPFTFFKDMFTNSKILTLKNIKFNEKTDKIFQNLANLIRFGVDGFMFDFGSKENEFLSQYSPFMATNIYYEFYNDLEKYFNDNKIKNKYNENVLLICSDNFGGKINFVEKSQKMFDITKEIYADLNFISNVELKKNNKHCIRCGYCKKIATEQNKISCSINPELIYDVRKYDLCNKKVAVIGAGVSGILTSNIIAKRNGRVDLFEEKNKINSFGRSCEVFAFDKYLKNFNNYIEDELKNNEFININLNKKFSAEMAKNYDCVVVATGFKELFLGVPGAVLKSVVSIYDILNRKFSFNESKHIVIYAKSELSLKLGLYLAKNKHDVTILINDYSFLMKIPQNLISYYLISACKYKIKFHVLCQVKTINEDSVELYINHKTKSIDYISLISNLISGKKYKFMAEARIIDCNLFIYDPDIIPNNKLYYEIIKSGYLGEVYIVGDALEISNLNGEVSSGFFVGNNI